MAPRSFAARPSPFRSARAATEKPSASARLARELRHDAAAAGQESLDWFGRGVPADAALLALRVFLRRQRHKDRGARRKRGSRRDAPGRSAETDRYVKWQ